MNCASNDLACLVRSTCPATCYPHVIGAHITVTERVESEAGPGWLYGGARVHCPVCTGEFTFFLDADLHPIRGRAPVAARDIANYTAAEKPELNSIQMGGSR